MSLGKKNSKLLQLNIRGNNVGTKKKEKNLSFNNNNSSIESILTLVPDYINYLLK